MQSLNEGFDLVERELVRQLAKLQVAKVVLTAIFDNLKRHFSNAWEAGAAVQECMNFNFWNYIWTVFDHVKLRSEAYQWFVEGDISSLERAETQDIQSMCARITEHLLRVN